MSDASPFSILQDISARAEAVNRALPEQQESTDAIDLIAFTLLGQKMMIEMTTVSEVTAVPSMTSLPRVNNWIKGVANIHGNIMPIIDLAAYFGLPRGRSGISRRVIAIDHPEIRVGLIVDQVHGMRHIRRDRFDEKSEEDLIDELRVLSAGQLEQEGERWTLLGVEPLIQSGLFNQIEVA